MDSIRVFTRNLWKNDACKEGRISFSLTCFQRATVFCCFFWHIVSKSRSFHNPDVVEKCLRLWLGVIFNGWAVQKQDQMLPVQNGPQDKTLTGHASFSTDVIYTPSGRQMGEKMHGNVAVEATGLLLMWQRSKPAPQEKCTHFYE